MSRFEQLGVSRQEDSVSKADSARSFHRSCAICCARGLRIDCERCAISYAHSMVSAAFDALAAGPAISPA